MIPTLRSLSPSHCSVMAASALTGSARGEAQPSLCRRGSPLEDVCIVLWSVHHYLLTQPQYSAHALHCWLHNLLSVLQMECVSRSRIFSALMFRNTSVQGLSSDGIQTYVTALRSAFLDASAVEAEAPLNGSSTGSSTAATDKARAWAVEQLCGAAQLPAANAETRMQALRFLAMHAFFDGRQPKKLKAAKVCSR